VILDEILGAGLAEVTSRDGTSIVYDEQGAGPALIIVDGALATRTSGSNAGLASLLAPHLRVYTYDRRGRGDSGDTMPYAVEREIEDLAAVIEAAGGTAALYGHSSGASLALEAAVALGGSRVRRLAMYEPPYDDDPVAREKWPRYTGRLTEALAEGRRGDAVALFMTYIGMPAEGIDGMRRAPFWRGLEAIAPTLAYDHTALLGEDGSVPVDRAARVPVPALVMYGTGGLAFMSETARTLAKVMPGATLRVIEGQTHQVAPEAVAPILTDFLAR
jgi:pimeloyl-ACP methyl ester carboxylesterase